MMWMWVLKALFVAALGFVAVAGSLAKPDRYGVRDET